MADVLLRGQMGSTLATSAWANRLDFGYFFAGKTLVGCVCYVKLWLAVHACLVTNRNNKKPLQHRVACVHIRHWREFKYSIFKIWVQIFIRTLHGDTSELSISRKKRHEYIDFH